MSTVYKNMSQLNRIGNNSHGGCDFYKGICHPDFPTPSPTGGGEGLGSPTGGGEGLGPPTGGGEGLGSPMGGGEG
jgi:hypothetical protein